MTETNVYDERKTLEKIYEQAHTRNFRVSLHGQQEMVDENIVLSEVTEAVNTAQFWKIIRSTSGEPAVCCMA